MENRRASKHYSSMRLTISTRKTAGLCTDGKGTPALVIGATGAEGARDDASLRQIRLAGRPVLLIDVFQTGTAVAPRDRSQRHFLTFNQSDDACRVQDILTALAWIH